MPRRAASPHYKPRSKFFEAARVVFHRMEARCGPPIEGAEAVTPELYKAVRGKLPRCASRGVRSSTSVERRPGDFVRCYLEKWHTLRYTMLAKAKHKEDDSIYSILLVFAAHYNDYQSVCDLLQTCPNTLARRRAGSRLERQHPIPRRASRGGPI